MSKRRKTIDAWASVGSHGHIFCCALAPNRPELVGRFEIFDTYEHALKMASGPKYVRKVKIYIDADSPPNGTPPRE